MLLTNIKIDVSDDPNAIVVAQSKSIILKSHKICRSM